MSGDRRLRSFHPIPAGLYRDRRYRRLSLTARVLLLDAHMLADDAEADGLVTTSDFSGLAGFGGIPLPDVAPAMDEMLDVGLLTEEGGGEYLLTEFRGLSHERREELREGARQRRQESAERREATAALSSPTRDAKRNGQRHVRVPEAEVEAE